MIILDTNIISEMMRRNPSAIVEKWISEKAITDQFAVTSISIAEICRGIYRLPNGNRRNRLEKN
ncbi:MAG: PIN domain-containing protein, partial [Calditrichota bacterium]